MYPNPYDPRARRDLSANELTVLRFADECLHGYDLSLIDQLISPNYTQHTAGIGQGREGLRKFILEIAWKRPGRSDWRPIHIFQAGDFVILHKLLQMVVIVDLIRFDAEGLMVEHWDVVQPLPEPGYDPMKLSTENHTRFKALFNVP